jgi:hypothetical protein
MWVLRGDDRRPLRVFLAAVVGLPFAPPFTGPFVERFRL